MASEEHADAVSREKRVDLFGERKVDHTEWWSEESGRVEEIVLDIIDTVEDRDDVQLAKRGSSVSRTGEHTASFELRIAGDPWEYHDKENERAVYRCGGCEKLHGEPRVKKEGPYEVERCPHCGTKTQYEDTEVRTVVF